jgi:hypothetical protein
MGDNEKWLLSHRACFIEMNVTAKKNQIDMDLGSQFSMARNGWAPSAVRGPTADRVF